MKGTCFRAKKGLCRDDDPAPGEGDLGFVLTRAVEFEFRALLCAVNGSWKPAASAEETQRVSNMQMLLGRKPPG